MASKPYRRRDLKNPKKDPYDNVDDLGVAIRVNAGTQQPHIGLLYKPDNENVRMCHLKGHFDLEDEIPDGSFRWLQVILDPVLRRLVVAAAQTVVARRDGIPFGFTFDGDCFVPGTGMLIKKDPGTGLTCATFVLAIFRMIRIELLDTSTWQARADDTLWQDASAEALGRKYPLVAPLVAQYAGNLRYRPEEVAAGGILEQRPCKFQDVVPIAKQIIKDLGR